MLTLLIPSIVIIGILSAFAWIKISPRYGTYIAFIGSILVVGLILALTLGSKPKDVVLTSLPKDIPAQKYIVDVANKKLYTEDNDGIRHLYGSDPQVLTLFASNYIPFYESTKVTTPVVDLKVERKYSIDYWNPFKYKSEVEVSVKRVLTQLGESNKTQAKEVKIQSAEVKISK